MHKAVTFAVLPALLTLAYRWYKADDFFGGLGAAVCILVIGLYLIYVDDRNEPLVVDNPFPVTYAVDVATAMDMVKTALLNAVFEGYRWRMLQFDPDLGSIAACLDVVDLELPPDRPAEAVRRQILLIAEFDAVAKKTRVRMQWRVRCGEKRQFATEAIHFTSQNIRRRLRSA